MASCYAYPARHTPLGKTLSTELAGAPQRCVHVGDRESDIYELYCLAENLGTNFLVRSFSRPFG